eukprot:CAMPEP_0119515166 /NCGR_PEP_ID=MMETSP1344-20130328/32745_1 /TAXON_ID=236787 /ORGANISM="Florenciella parvula, Strain CCMP2471" /LENGTH=250 /DNA_ID=CAMNT_0007552543 /DNA_START=16 /DNA_END=765 /DNA_ORIENTATION=-
MASLAYDHSALRDALPNDENNENDGPNRGYDDNVDELEQVVRLVQSIEEEEDAMQARKVLGELQDADYAVLLGNKALEEDMRLQRMEEEDERLARTLMMEAKAKEAEWEEKTEAAERENVAASEKIQKEELEGVKKMRSFLVKKWKKTKVDAVIEKEGMRLTVILPHLDHKKTSAVVEPSRKDPHGWVINIRANSKVPETPKWFSVLGVSKNLSPVWYQCSVTVGSRSKSMFDMQRMTWDIKENGKIEVL